MNPPANKVIRVVADEPPVEPGDYISRMSEERRVVSIERDPTREQPTWLITLQAA